MSSEKDSNSGCHVTIAETPFIETGLLKDEVKLVFDDERKLYVSESFLSMCSPVFKAMFANEFLEKNEMSVKLTGKSYDDFLEFLLCIHPSILKSIDDSNASRLAPIADEYQSPIIAAKCEKIMKTTIIKEFQSIQEKWRHSFSDHVSIAWKCLTFLKAAVTFGYKSVEEEAIKVLICMPSALYSRMYKDKQAARNYLSNKPNQTLKKDERNVTVTDLYNECLTLFETLPVETKFMITSKRLAKCETFEYLS